MKSFTCRIDEDLLSGFEVPDETPWNYNSEKTFILGNAITFTGIHEK